MKDELKSLDLVLERVINEINSGKDKIFVIVENLRDEFAREKQELDNVIAAIEKAISEVDALQDQDKNMRKRLATVSMNFKSSDANVQEIYDEALDIRVKYVTKQKEEQELRKKRDKLEISLKNYLKNIAEADGVVKQVSVALNYLTGDFGHSIEDFEDVAKMNMAIRILEVQEEERSRIAREVHDGPAQYLASAIMRTDLCKMIIQKDLNQGLLELDDLKISVQKALKEVRGVIFDLRPPFLDKQTLGDSIQDLIDTFIEESNIKIDVKIKGARECDQILEVGIYRIIQELLNNIKKHSEAESAEIGLEIGKDFAYIVVKDDGIGFEVDEVMDVAKKVKVSYGIIGILDRVNQLGGNIDINSKRNNGTRVKIKLPVIRGKE